MSATKYQVLYRYINEATNSVITNDMNSDYEPIHMIYADPSHKIFSTDESIQLEAFEEQQEMISYANDINNTKNNMLFAYDGTKKIRHQKWVTDQTGYVVRDWKQLKRSSIGNKGNYNKEFTTLNASTPEDGGVVVCTKAVLSKYIGANGITVIDGSTLLEDAGTTTNPYYTDKKVTELINNATFFSVHSPTLTASNTQYLKTGAVTGTTYYVGPVAIGANNKQMYSSSYGKVFGQETADNLYGSVKVMQSDIETLPIPAHYEDDNDAPYVIIDTYKKIQLSPWFVNCTCGSLESAITKAKKLIEMIGIENVKVIKVVPFDQSIKIK